MPDIAAIPLSVSSARPLAYQGFLCSRSAHAHPQYVCVSVCASEGKSLWHRVANTNKENANEPWNRTDFLLGYISHHNWISLAARVFSSLK